MSAGAAFAGIEAGAALLGGILDRSTLRAQARVHEENARLSLLEGEEIIARTMREERQVSGAAIAAMAESGTRLGTGTAADIIRQNAIEREVEIGNIRAQAQGRARNEKQAAVDARRAGDDALIGGVISAAARVGSFAAQEDARKKVDAQLEAERKARLKDLQVDRGLPVDRAPAAAGYGVHAHDPRNPFKAQRRFGVLGLPGAY